MAKTLQLRRGTTAEITANTPASGELFVDTEKKTVTVGDGSTAGGIILARNDRVSDVYNAANAVNGMATGAYNTANGANGLAAGAYNTANGAVSLAQAAFDQANTGGGGGGIVVNADYSKSVEIANTYGYNVVLETFTTADFTDTSVTINDDVSSSSYNPAADSLDFYAAGVGASNARLILYGANGTLQSNITNLIGTYVEFSSGNTYYAAKVLNAYNDGTTSIFSLKENTVDPLPTASNWNYDTLSTLLKFGVQSRISWSSASSNFKTTLDSLKANANFTYANTVSSNTYTVTANGQPYLSGIFNRVNIEGDYKPIFNTTGDVTINGKTPANKTWTFDLDGSFDSQSALIGDVLISDDIVTPLVYDSYGVVDPIQTGTLTVNGNLDVTGNLTATGLATANFGSTIVPDTNDRASAFTNGKILEINKKYFIQNSAGGHVIMPSTTGLSNGDVVEIYYKNSGGFTTTNLTVWAYAATGIEGDDIQKPAWINLNSLSPGESGGYAYMELSGQGMKITFIFRSAASKIWEIQY